MSVKKTHRGKTAKRPSSLRPVYVVFDDVLSLAGWYTAKSLKIETCGASRIHAIGFVVRITKEEITIAPCVPFERENGDSDDFLGPIRIPRKVVLHFQEIEVPLFQTPSEEKKGE